MEFANEIFKRTIHNLIITFRVMPMASQAVFNPGATLFEGGDTPSAEG